MLVLLIMALPGWSLAAAHSSKPQPVTDSDTSDYDEGYTADFELADKPADKKPAPKKDPDKEFTRGRMAFLFGQYKAAYKIWKPLADKGYAKAQSTLGWMYHTGKGVKQDYGKAFDWYQKAADQKNVIAQNNLGVFYEQGLGVGKSPTTAAKWYRESAEWGYSFAQYNLGMLYRQGLGVKHDEKEALFWLQIAALQGVDQAVAELEKISGQSHGGKTQIAKAPVWKKVPAPKHGGSSHTSPHDSSSYKSMAERIKRHRSDLNSPGYGGSLSGIVDSPATPHSTPSSASKSTTVKQKPAAKAAPESGSKTVSADTASSDQSSVPPAVTDKIPEDKFDKWLTDARVAQTRLKNAKLEKRTNSHSLEIFNDEWVSEQDPKYFTLQLARSDELDWLLSFAKRQPMLKQTAYFTEIKDGKKWYYLIYGNFKNRQAAEAEIKNLPKSLKKWAPWVRSFSELQAKMNLKLPKGTKAAD
ncbi:MAG: SPOR domain-containing protein [Gammaproteobacteria bacterium]